MLKFLVLVLLIFFCVLLLAGCAITLLFYCTAYQSTCATLPTPPGNQWPRIVIATTKDLMWGTFLRLCGLKKQFLYKGLAVRATECQPVLCIHGLYLNDGTWHIIRPRLEAQGFATYSFRYSSFKGSLETILKELDEHITAISRIHPGQKPLLLAHSLGGLLIRQWMLQQDNQERISGVITLGTPHLGSQLAYLALGSIAKNLRPGSEFLHKLNEKSQLPKIPCTSMVSSADAIVVPPCNLLPPEGWKTVVTKPVGHVRMLFDLEVIMQLQQEMALFLPATE